MGVLRQQVQAGYLVTIQRDGSVGTIYYTTDGSDPRAEGGVARGISGGSDVTLTIEATTNLKARTRSSSEWSALHEAVFFVEQDFRVLRITEIMYNPQPAEAGAGLSIESIVGNDRAGGYYDLANVKLSVPPPQALTEGDKVVIAGAREPANNGTFTVHHVSGRNVILKEVLTDEMQSRATVSLLYDGDRYEFIELKNTGTRPLNLSGIVFTEGIRYAFQDGTCLAPGQFAVMVSHAIGFADRYPGVSVCGDYGGHLDNGGETLELSLGTGEVFPVRGILGNGNGYCIVFDELPAGLEPGDRIQLERARHVSNNGMRRITFIEEDKVFVTGLLSEEGRGAKATFFRVVTQVTYDDKAPWPRASDGLGYSLVPTEINPTGNPNDSARWRTSAHIHGSPGQDDP